MIETSIKERRVLWAIVIKVVQMRAVAVIKANHAADKKNPADVGLNRMSQAVI